VDGPACCWPASVLLQIFLPYNIAICNGNVTRPAAARAGPPLAACLLCWRASASRPGRPASRAGQSVSSKQHCIWQMTAGRPGPAVTGAAHGPGRPAFGPAGTARPYISTRIMLCIGRQLGWPFRLASSPMLGRGVGPTARPGVLGWPRRTVTILGQGNIMLAIQQ